MVFLLDCACHCIKLKGLQIQFIWRACEGLIAPRALLAYRLTEVCFQENLADRSMLPPEGLPSFPTKTNKLHFCLAMALNNV